MRSYQSSLRCKRQAVPLALLSEREVRSSPRVRVRQRRPRTACHQLPAGMARLPPSLSSCPNFRPATQGASLRRHLAAWARQPARTAASKSGSPRTQRPSRPSCPVPSSPSPTERAPFEKFTPRGAYSFPPLEACTAVPPPPSTPVALTRNPLPAQAAGLANVASRIATELKRQKEIPKKSGADG